MGAWGPYFHRDPPNFMTPDPPHEMSCEHISTFDRVTVKVGTRKWGNGKKAQSLHSTQQTAEILLLQSSMIKSMSIQYLYWEEYLSILYGLHQRGMQRHCIMVGKLVLHFWQFVKFMHYSYPVPTFYEESFWAVFGFLLHYGATHIIGGGRYLRLGGAPMMVRA